VKHWIKPIGAALPLEVCLDETTQCWAATLLRFAGAMSGFLAILVDIHSHILEKKHGGLLEGATLGRG
jgi:hypothetical protein